MPDSIPGRYYCDRNGLVLYFLGDVNRAGVHARFYSPFDRIVACEKVGGGIVLYEEAEFREIFSYHGCISEGNSC